MRKTSALVLLGLSQSVMASGEMISLATSPLFISSTVAPNIYLLLDDSGSMDWEVLSPQYWHECAYDPNGNGSFSSAACGGLITDGTFYTYFSGASNQINYIYQNSDNVYGTGCNKSTFANSVQACSGSNTYEWRFYTPDLNGVYYDNDTTFTPWPGPCISTGTACANASFTAARSNPYSGTSGYSVTQNLSGMIYEVWMDNRGFSGTQPQRGNNVNATTGANGVVDLWDDHIRIVVNSANATVTSYKYNPTKTGMNPTITLQATLSGTACFNALGSSALVTQMYAGTLAYNSTGGTGCLTLAQAQQNIANWYQYYRKHNLAARNAFAAVVATAPNYKYALSTINDNNGDTLFVPFPASTVTNYTSQNNTIVTSLFNLPQQALGTPTPGGLSQAGTYFQGGLSGRTNPIATACQQNYTMVVTDGFWNDSSGVPNAVGNCDGDAYSKTLADVACYYYNTDLSSLANQVPTNSNDPANWQHMVTYGVGFGITGNLVAGANGWPTPPLVSNSNWGDPFTDPQAAVDDLWHAAWNSHGVYLDATKSSQVASSLSSILSNISSRQGSNSSVAQNSSTLQTTTQVYQAGFNTNNWQGSFLAFPVNANGSIGATASWDAGCVLTGGTCANPAGSNAGLNNTQRVILTRDWSNTGYQSIAFEFPTNYTTLGPTYSTRFTGLMQYAPYAITTSNSAQISANQAYGQALFNYFRGDRTQEAQNGGTYTMRNRNGRLGDIIDSSPTYVGAPSSYFTGTLASSYSTFASTYANRTPMVYIGANDAMLHGFRASDGRELVAYIPGDRVMYSKIAGLSQTSYTHQNYVDGEVITGDAQVNGNWATVLVGSLHGGGQGIYALNVTNPALFSESTPSNLLLWEFTDDNDADMGYSFSVPSIVRVNNGSGTTSWAVIIGNGYNNSQSDGKASTTGLASLMVLLLNGPSAGVWTQGTNYFKIPVGTGSVAAPNGLSTPTPVDINGDGIVDYVYAGDLNGNMWRFDLTSSTPATWSTKATLLFNANNATAGDEPITVAPIVTAHPLGGSFGQLVYFGTGKYLETSDNTQASQATQAFYAIWDQNKGATVTKASLLQQQILGEVTTSYTLPTGGTQTYTQRNVSANAINWAAGSGQNLGWYINLIENGASSNFGERVVQPAIVRNGTVIFVTLIPSSSSCTAGGTSWIMELDAATGGRLNQSPIDFNGDNQFNSSDYVALTVAGKTTMVAAGGFQSPTGITARPSIILGSSKTSEIKVVNGTGGVASFNENPGAHNLGRQTWRQLK